MWYDCLSECVQVIKSFRLGYDIVGTVALELQHTRVEKSDSSKSLTSSEVKRPSHLELPKGLNIQSLQKRPSIAPVPAFLEANDIRIQLNSDVETDEEEEIPSINSEEIGSEYVPYSFKYTGIIYQLGTQNCWRPPSLKINIFITEIWKSQSKVANCLIL